MYVIGIGDNVCDKYEDQGIMYPGGQALNFSIYARILGVKSAYLGVFGQDLVAETVQSALRKYQVDYRRCRYYPGENGFARVQLVEGERIFLGSNQGGVLRTHPLQLDEEDCKYLQRFTLCHTSNNSYFEDQLPKLPPAGLSISYDFSNQWRDPSRVAQVAPWIRYAFLSCGSAPLSEVNQVCQELLDAGVELVIATQGAQGAYLYDGLEVFHQPPHLVKAVDTLGAGDAFATAFLLHWLAPSRPLKDRASHSMHIRQSLEKAAAFAAQTCLTFGAFGEGRPLEGPSEREQIHPPV